MSRPIPELDFEAEFQKLVTLMRACFDQEDPELKPTYRDCRSWAKSFTSNVRRSMASRDNNGWLGDNGEGDLTERFELVQQIRDTILNHEDIREEKDKIELLQTKEVWAHLMVLSLPRLRAFLAEVQTNDDLVYTLNLAFPAMNSLILLCEYYLSIFSFFTIVRFLSSSLSKLADASLMRIPTTFFFSFYTYYRLTSSSSVRGPAAEWVKTGTISRSNADRIAVCHLFVMNLDSTNSFVLDGPERSRCLRIYRPPAR